MTITITLDIKEAICLNKELQSLMSLKGLKADSVAVVGKVIKATDIVWTPKLFLPIFMQMVREMEFDSQKDMDYLLSLEPFYEFFVNMSGVNENHWDVFRRIKPFIKLDDLQELEFFLDQYDNISGQA